MRVFADDACLTLRDKDLKVLEIKANQELQKIDDWVKINMLTINYLKSNCILFHRQNITRKFEVKMSGKTIKYLGVHIDQGLRTNSVNSSKTHQCLIYYNKTQPLLNTTKKCYTTHLFFYKLTIG